MSQAEELLESLSLDEAVSQVSETETKSHIVIGENRVMTVPNHMKRIAVQYDHDVNTITFDCPRYSDGLDMSKMAIYINYLRSDGYTDACAVDNITIDDVDSNIMHFDWTISSNVTAVKGTIAFLVCVKNVDSNGKLVNHWNSELNKDLYVSEGLETSEEIAKEYYDLVASLLIRMDHILSADSPILDTSLTESGLAADAKAVGTKISNEATARSQADSTLDTKISNETTARTEADTALDTKISNEITSRTEADTALDTKISNEITSRTEADTALDTKISNEATARSQADSTLDTKISNETTARTEADTALDTKISNETTARTEADNELKDRIRVNLLRSTLGTTTVNGVTCTNNGDGTYTISGTPSSTVYFRVATLKLKKGLTYKIVSYDNAKKHMLASFIQDTTGSQTVWETDNNGTFTAEYEDYTVEIRYHSGTYNNAIFKPMITTDLTATYDDFVSYEDSLQPGINTGLKMELLWTNASPQSTFANQTISLDLSKYNFLNFEFHIANQSNMYSVVPTVELIVENKPNNFRVSGVHNSICSREFSIDGNSITFGVGKNISSYNSTTLTTENDLAVPYKIYGIK